jgi:hypothetical protein
LRKPSPDQEQTLRFNRAVAAAVAAGAPYAFLAASELGRKAILIELNPTYAQMGRERTTVCQPQLQMLSIRPDRQRV